MPGIGKGAWPRLTAKKLCEDCFRLDVNLLAGDGAIFPGRRGVISWESRSFTASKFAIRFEVRSDSFGERILRIAFCWDDGEFTTQEILLTVTKVTFGFRSWFRCPAGTNSEKPCGRRCAMLYLLNGRFACRACHSLVYASQRESRALQRALRRNWFGEFSRADIRQYAKRR